MTCGLLWLNPGAQGKHFTSQLPRVACVLWPLNIGLMLVLLTFFLMVRMVLLLWVVDAILGDGYGT